MVSLPSLAPDINGGKTILLSQTIQAQLLDSLVLATLYIRAKNWVINLTLGSVSCQLTANLGG